MTTAKSGKIHDYRYFWLRLQAEVGVHSYFYRHNSSPNQAGERYWVAGTFRACSARFGKYNSKRRLVDWTQVARSGPLRGLHPPENLRSDGSPDGVLSQRQRGISATHWREATVRVLSRRRRIPLRNFATYAVEILRRSAPQDSFGQVRN